MFVGPATAATISVGPGGDLQGAINSARFGDTIVVEKGTTWPGISLPNKGTAPTGTDADYITIQTSGNVGCATCRITSCD